MINGSQFVIAFDIQYCVRYVRVCLCSVFGQNVRKQRDGDDEFHTRNAKFIIMGCGQSQFSLIYPKKFKRKDRKNKGKILRFHVSVTLYTLLLITYVVRTIFHVFVKEALLKLMLLLNKLCLYSRQLTSTYATTENVVFPEADRLS